MASVEAVAAAKLVGTPLVNDAVSGNIFPEFRDGVYPAIVYDIDLSDTDDTYEVTGTVTHDLSIAVVAATGKQAKEIADLIVDALNGVDEWQDQGFRVASCFLSDRHNDTIPLASKNLRLAAVFLTFDFTVDGLTST